MSIESQIKQVLEELQTKPLTSIAEMVWYLRLPREIPIQELSPLSTIIDIVEKQLEMKWDEQKFKLLQYLKTEEVQKAFNETK